MSVVNFKEAKRTRNELELPNLHFIVVDDWIDVIGERAVMAWLRMYSWCDRSNQVIDDDISIKIDTWEQASIPTSLNSLIKRLGVGRDTFYNKILKPLWNVGLVDIEEFKNSKSEGVKPLNIIVYKYPQNNFSLAVKPLEIIRNYEKDYSSTSKTFAKKGGRPKKQEKASEADAPMPDKGVVLKENGGWFSNRTGDGSKIEPINSLNSITKNLNSITNISDTKDTIANPSTSLKKMDSEIHSSSEKTKEEQKEAYFNKGFYNNSEHVPEKISHMLKVFSRTQKEAREYYNIILLAKKNNEDGFNYMIWLENEDELVNEIEDAFSRAVRKIEQEGSVKNEQGYLYQTVYQTIHSYIATRLRGQEDTESGRKSIYFNWLEEDVDNE